MIGWSGRRIAAIDLETTGIDVASAEIVQVGLSRPHTIHAGALGDIDSRAWLVKPSRPIPPSASAIHGYDDAAVADAPAFAEILPEIQHATADVDLLVTFNGAKFDLPILRRYGLGWTGDHLDAFRVWCRVRDLNLESPASGILSSRYTRSLGSAMAWLLGREPTEYRAHHADADCEMTLRLADYFVGRFGLDACLRL